MTEKEGGLLEKEENIVNAPELDISLTTEGNIFCDGQKISLKQVIKMIKKGQEKCHLKELDFSLFSVYSGTNLGKLSVAAMPIWIY